MPLIEKESAVVESIIELISQQQTNLTDIISAELLYNVFVYKDKALLNVFRARLQQEMLDQLEDLAQSNMLTDAKINNLLAFIAYTEPTSGSEISIPILVDGEFIALSYRIERINLTADEFSAPYVAYGLIPPEDSHAPAKLLFMGTTYPTAKGFAQTILADTAPGGGVGAYLYHQGKAYIQQWINEYQQKTQQPVQCVGQSLGGAMSIQCYVHQPDKVTFTAINPPFLTNKERRKLEARLASSTLPTTDNKVFSHQQDLVNQIGHWLPPQCTVYLHGKGQVFSDNPIEQSFKAHAALISQKTFTTLSGEAYSETLAEDSARMRLHQILKPVRAGTFALTYSLTALSSIFRQSAKAVGLTEWQAQGPQQDVISDPEAASASESTASTLSF